MAFEHAFQQAFLYLAAAVVAVLVGKGLRLGAVLGYLLVGAAIGPWGFHWIGHEGEQITHFAEFGVVVMLFIIGLELQPTMLWKMRHQLIGLGSLQVGICSLAIMGICVAADIPWKPALALGLILAMSSTAIVLQTLAEKGLLHTRAGQNSFAVLLFQDIAVIPIIALLPLLGNGALAATAHGQSDAWMTHWPGWGKALATLGAVAIVIVVARIGMRHVFSAIARTRQREAFTGAALLLVIGVALLMTKVGLSPALGAFVAGVVLAGSEYRHELESDLDPFKGLLLGLFFLGVGAGIDFGYIRAHLLLVIGGAAGLVLVKGLILYGISMLKERHGDSALVFSSALAAGGEFAFVLITLSRSSGVLDAETGRAAMAIVALSMATTPLLIMGARRLVSRPNKEEAERETDAKDEGNPVIICGFGRFGHAVGRLLRSRGFGCTVLDHDTDQVELLRNIGVPIFYGDASRPELLTIAGAERAKFLVIALRDGATSLKIVKNARRHHPHLEIFVRAYSRLEAYEYIDAKESRIYRDTLDSSLRMGGDLLRMLGETEEDVDRATRLYRDRDEEMVKDMALHRHDSKEFLSAAREAHRSLNELMKSDIASGRAGPSSKEKKAG